MSGVLQFLSTEMSRATQRGASSAPALVFIDSCLRTCVFVPRPAVHGLTGRIAIVVPVPLVSVSCHTESGSEGFRPPQYRSSFLGFHGTGCMCMLLKDAAQGSGL